MENPTGGRGAAGDKAAEVCYKLSIISDASKATSQASFIGKTALNEIIWFDFMSRRTPQKEWLPISLTSTTQWDHVGSLTARPGSILTEAIGDFHPYRIELIPNKNLTCLDKCNGS